VLVVSGDVVTSTCGTGGRAVTATIRIGQPLRLWLAYDSLRPTLQSGGRELLELSFSGLDTVLQQYSGITALLGRLDVDEPVSSGCTTQSGSIPTNSIIFVTTHTR
jgi:hypothetical protein